MLLWLLNVRISGEPIAPACIEHSGFGGCYGRQAIPLQISWSMIRCLEIDTNICSEPTIQINNTCETSVVIENKEYKNDEGYINLDQTGKNGIVFISGKVWSKPFYILSFIARPHCQ